MYPLFTGVIHAVPKSFFIWASYIIGLNYHHPSFSPNKIQIGPSFLHALKWKQAKIGMRQWLSGTLADLKQDFKREVGKKEGPSSKVRLFCYIDHRATGCTQKGAGAPQPGYLCTPGLCRPVPSLVCIQVSRLLCNHFLYFLVVCYY